MFLWFRRPLTPPYIGPFLVLERAPKTFVISKSGKEVTVSIDRVKPAFLSTDVLPGNLLPFPVSRSTASSDPCPLGPSDPAFVSLAPRAPLPVTSSVAPQTFTSSGRCVRPPERLRILVPAFRLFLAVFCFLILSFCLCCIFVLFFGV